MLSHSDHEHEEIIPFEELGHQFEKHAKHPENMKAVTIPDGRALGKGSCGDAVEIAIKLDGEVIVDIGHQPNGCAYTVACASAVTQLAKGRTIDAALELQPEDVERTLGGLPEDHLHCARLAVNTLGEAIADALAVRNKVPT